MPRKQLTNAEKQWLQLRQNKLRENTQKVSNQIYRNRLSLNRYGNQTHDWLLGERIAKNPIRYKLFKLHQPLIKAFTAQRDAFRENARGLLAFTEGWILLWTFIFTVLLFPIHGLLDQNGDFTALWAAPALFIMAAFALDKLSESQIEIPQWVFVLISSAAQGVWLAFSLQALLILNSWYAEPELSTWEPLFTATGLSSAGVLLAERFINEIRKRQKGN